MTHKNDWSVRDHEHQPSRAWSCVHLMVDDSELMGGWVDRVSISWMWHTFAQPHEHFNIVRRITLLLLQFQNIFIVRIYTITLSDSSTTTGCSLLELRSNWRILGEFILFETMVSCHIIADGIRPIILDKKGCDEPAICHVKQHSKKQLGMNASSLSTLGIPQAPNNICVTTTCSRKCFNPLTKFVAVFIISAYVVSSASAFSQSNNRMGTTSMPFSVARQCAFSSTRSNNILLSAIPRTRLFLSARNDVSTDWKAVFSALQLYKAAYGDLKVPSKFVVPSAAPWPGM